MTIVLVHGGWGGGWTWRDTARLLRADGYDVYAPTLTGLAERSHVAPEQVGLGSHIADIEGLLRFEELDEVLLVGHSYGGMVITGAADRAADRVTGMIYLDAFVPEPGQSLWDITGPAARERQEEAARRHDGGRTVPRTASPARDDPDSARFESLFTGQPLGCFSEPYVPVRPEGGRSWPRRHYVVCTGDPTAIFHRYARAASAQADWEVSELAAMHDVVRSRPAVTAQRIAEIARAWGIES